MRPQEGTACALEPQCLEPKWLEPKWPRRDGLLLFGEQLLFVLVELCQHSIEACTLEVPSFGLVQVPNAVLGCFELFLNYWFGAIRLLGLSVGGFCALWLIIGEAFHLV